MTKHRYFVDVFACILILTLAVQSSNVSTRAAGGKDMENLFAELQQLASARSSPVDPTTAADHLKREQEIDQEYQRNGAAAMTFLLNKLSVVNEREKLFIHGPDDIEGGLQFLASEAEAGRTTLTRYAICYILSDMYHTKNGSQRKEIIQGLVNSFLPSTQGREDVETMDGALFRLGSDGVEGFLELANSPSEFNRCHASLILKGLGKSGAPQVDCTADASTRVLSIAAFRNWWKVNSSTVRWPVFPSYFDAPPTPRSKQ
jgi:hypothetical protein